MGSNDGVAGLREEIAAVDRRIADLLARRLRLARSLGALKREADLGAYAPAQEVAVYERLRAAANVPSAAAGALARELISAGLHAQSPLRLACVGERFGPARHAAARAFGSMAEPLDVASIEAAAELVLAGDVDYLVAAWGSALCQRLLRSGLQVCRLVELDGGEAQAVVGRHRSEPSGRDTTAVGLIGWSGPIEPLDRLTPGAARPRLLPEGVLVLELPGHPEHGALRQIERPGPHARRFERCLVLGSWPSFPGEVESER